MANTFPFGANQPERCADRASKRKPAGLLSEIISARRVQPFGPAGRRCSIDANAGATFVQRPVIAMANAFEVIVGWIG